MAGKLLVHLRRQWIGVIALFVALGGTALATHPGGQNTISTADIQNGQVKTDDIGNGEVKVTDIGQGAVATDEIANNQVKAADLGDGEVKTAEIANGQVKTADIGSGEVRSGNVANDNLTGADVAPNSLKGTDIDEATLDVGDAARAYAHVNPFTCTGTPGTCPATASKGISSVTREGTGLYCVTAPGIDGSQTSAAVTVEFGTTAFPVGNTSAMIRVPNSCAGGDGFAVLTERQPTTSATTVGPADLANDVGFTIVIP